MRWQESFWVIPGETDVAGRAAYLTAKTLAILTTYCIVTAPFMRLYYEGHPFVTSVMFVPIVLLLIAAVIPAKPLRVAFVALPPKEKERLWKNPHVYLALFAILLATACIAAWYATVFLSDDRHMESRFLSWRSVNLLSGVSPELPFLFAAATVIWWAWMHFRRLILLEGRTPTLPYISQAGPEFDFSGLSDSVLEAVRQAFFRWKWRVLIAVVILLLIIFDPLKLLHSFERPLGFDWMYRVALGLMASLIFLTCSRMLVTWERLKLFLEELERHPLRSAFSSMPKDRVWSPVVQMGGAMRRTYLYEMRAMETARKLHQIAPAILPAPVLENLVTDIRIQLARVARGKRITFVEAQGTYDTISSVSEGVAAGCLRSSWRKGSSETLAAFEEKVEAKTSDRPPPDPEGDLLKVAAEFVALPYLFFIRVILLQIHNLLFFVAGGFVLMVLSLCSYPFQAPRALGWCMTAALMALGYGVVRMLAQMSKDPVLSRITETTPGKLDSDFFLKLASAGALPVLSVILSQFPSVSRFLFSWLQPTLQAIQ